IGVGSGCTYHKNLVTNLKNCPKDKRGLAIGVPVSAFGLSAFLFSKLSSLFFYKFQTPASLEKTLDVKSLLIFVGMTCLIINLVTPIFFKDVSYLNDVIQLDEEHSEEEVLLEESEENDIEPFQQVNRQVTLLEENIDVNCFKTFDGYFVGVCFILLTGVGLLQINNVGYSIVLL
ncbi:hypothetical protein HK099_001310, partial [Clydaea vesicula]